MIRLKDQSSKLQLYEKNDIFGKIMKNGAYSLISFARREFRHITVNHGVNFVDPNTSANTQISENKNNQWKESPWHS
jgi:hypothetical protein